MHDGHAKLRICQSAIESNGGQGDVDAGVIAMNTGFTPEKTFIRYYFFHWERMRIVRKRIYPAIIYLK
jgi:hypothetical protein